MNVFQCDCCLGRYPAEQKCVVSDREQAKAAGMAPEEVTFELCPDCADKSCNCYEWEVRFPVGAVSG